MPPRLQPLGDDPDFSTRPTISRINQPSQRTLNEPPSQHPYQPQPNSRLRPLAPDDIVITVQSDFDNSMNDLPIQPLSNVIQQQQQQLLQHQKGGSASFSKFATLKMATSSNTDLSSKQHVVSPTTTIPPKSTKSNHKLQGKPIQFSYQLPPQLQPAPIDPSLKSSSSFGPMAPTPPLVQILVDSIYQVPPSIPTQIHPQSLFRNHPQIDIMSRELPYNVFKAFQALDQVIKGEKRNSMIQFGPCVIYLVAFIARICHEHQSWFAQRVPSEFFSYAEGNPVLKHSLQIYNSYHATMCLARENPNATNPILPVDIESMVITNATDNSEQHIVMKSVHDEVLRWVTNVGNLWRNNAPFSKGRPADSDICEGARGIFTTPGMVLDKDMFNAVVKAKNMPEWDEHDKYFDGQSRISKTTRWSDITKITTLQWNMDKDSISFFRWCITKVCLHLNAVVFTWDRPTKGKLSTALKRNKTQLGYVSSTHGQSQAQSRHSQSQSSPSPPTSNLSSSQISFLSMGKFSNSNSQSGQGVSDVSFDPVVVEQGFKNIIVPNSTVSKASQSISNISSAIALVESPDDGCAEPTPKVAKNPKLSKITKDTDSVPSQQPPLRVSRATREIINQAQQLVPISPKIKAIVSQQLSPMKRGKIITENSQKTDGTPFSTELTSISEQSSPKSFSTPRKKTANITSSRHTSPNMKDRSQVSPMKLSSPVARRTTRAGAAAAAAKRIDPTNLVSIPTSPLRTRSKKATSQTSSQTLEDYGLTVTPKKKNSLDDDDDDDDGEDKVILPKRTNAILSPPDLKYDRMTRSQRRQFGLELSSQSQLSSASFAVRKGSPLSVASAASFSDIDSNVFPDVNDKMSSLLGTPSKLPPTSTTVNQTTTTKSKPKAKSVRATTPVKTTSRLTYLDENKHLKNSSSQANSINPNSKQTSPGNSSSINGDTKDGDHADNGHDGRDDGDDELFGNDPHESIGQTDGQRAEEELYPTILEPSSPPTAEVFAHPNPTDQPEVSAKLSTLPHPPTPSPLTKPYPEIIFPLYDNAFDYLESVYAPFTPATLRNNTLTIPHESLIYCVTHLILVASEFGSRPFLFGKQCTMPEMQYLSSLLSSWLLYIAQGYPTAHALNRELVTEVVACLYIAKHNGIFFTPAVLRAMRSTVDLCLVDYYQRWLYPIADIGRVANPPINMNNITSAPATKTPAKTPASMTKSSISVQMAENLRLGSASTKETTYIPIISFNQDKDPAACLFAQYHTHFLIGLLYALAVIDAFGGAGSNNYPTTTPPSTSTTTTSTGNKGAQSKSPSPATTPSKTGPEIQSPPVYPSCPDESVLQDSTQHQWLYEAIDRQYEKYTDFQTMLADGQLAKVFGGELPPNLNFWLLQRDESKATQLLAKKPANIYCTNLDTSTFDNGYPFIYQQPYCDKNDGGVDMPIALKQHLRRPASDLCGCPMCTYQIYVVPEDRINECITLCALIDTDRFYLYQQTIDTSMSRPSTDPKQESHVNPFTSIPSILDEQFVAFVQVPAVTKEHFVPAPNLEGLLDTKHDKFITLWQQREVDIVSRHKLWTELGMNTHNQTTLPLQRNLGNQHLFDQFDEDDVQVGTKKKTTQKQTPSTSAPTPPTVPPTTATKTTKQSTKSTAGKGGDGTKESRTGAMEKLASYYQQYYYVQYHPDLVSENGFAQAVKKGNKNQ